MLRIVCLLDCSLFPADEENFSFSQKRPGNSRAEKKKKVDLLLLNEKCLFCRPVEEIFHARCAPTIHSDRRLNQQCLFGWAHTHTHTHMHREALNSEPKFITLEIEIGRVG